MIIGNIFALNCEQNIRKVKFVVYPTALVVRSCKNINLEK